MKITGITTASTSESTLRVLCRLEYGDARIDEIFVEVDGEPGMRPPANANWAAMIGLFPAMMTGEYLHIDGRVDLDLLKNLSELNAIWHCWRPATYNRLRISASEVDTCERRADSDESWLLAFSGGVDAIATLIRHSGGDVGWRQRAIGAAFFVHGFDVPLADHGAFNLAFDSAEKFLHTTGIPLWKIRTNLRDTKCDWEDVFGLSLAAVASVAGAGHRGLLMGSGSNYYLNPIIRWGSSPIIDPLHGCTRFQVYTDGCEQGRAEKIKLLAGEGNHLEHLRVCWQMDSNGGNCGRCEKCVRTKLMFLANRHEPPGCLGPALEPACIRSLTLRTKPQICNFREIAELAGRNGISDWWVGEVRELIKRTEHSTFSSMLPHITREIKRFISQGK